MAKKLLVESGSTKSEWVLISENKIAVRKSTPGLNASYMTMEVLVEMIHSYELRFLDESNLEIYYYGAGCSGETRIYKMHSALAKCFPNHHSIFVFNDLMAAAHAALGASKGIIAIMGTGSNIAYYDGKQLDQNYTSGGYLLSDEGGGVNLGKSLLRKFLYHQLSTEIDRDFRKTYELDEDTLIVELYKSDRPNRYMASFAKFLKMHEASPEIKKIIDSCFKQFIETHVLQYKNTYDLPLSIVGSVGYHFKEHLLEISENYGIEVNKIIASPLQDLIHFHQNIDRSIF